jgi:hypothetical protein
VSALGAVQSQDYAGAKWAVAQRTRACTDADVEAALDRGAILRTHALRPTWHFVVPADIRWLLRLTAPRVHAASATYHRKTDLDETTFARSDAAVSNGRVVGNWRRSARGDEVAVEVTLPVALDDDEMEALAAQAARYGRFLGLRARLRTHGPGGAARRRSRAGTRP